MAEGINPEACDRWRLRSAQKNAPNKRSIKKISPAKNKSGLMRRMKNPNTRTAKLAFL
jgi:hypothetical protein